MDEGMPNGQIQKGGASMRRESGGLAEGNLFVIS